MTPPHAPVRRFVLDGLQATLTAHTAGTLPLSRLARELTARLGTLTPLVPLPHHRTLTTLRAAVHTVATLDTSTDAAGQPLSSTDLRILNTALATITTAVHDLHTPATTVATAAGTGSGRTVHRPAATFRPVVVPFPRSPLDPSRPRRQAPTATNPTGGTASRPTGGDRTPAA